MQSPKYYIHEYYLKSALFSFLGMILIAVTLNFVLSNQIPETYLYIQLAAAVIIFSIGIIALGAYNAFKAANNTQKVLTFHAIFTALLLIIELLYSSSSLWMILLRNVGIFILLQIGSFLYVKRQKNKLPS